jgi:hypothetical protein
VPRIVGYGGIGVRVAVIQGRSGSADSDSRFAVRYPYPLSTARTDSIASSTVSAPNTLYANADCANGPTMSKAANPEGRYACAST